MIQQTTMQALQKSSAAPGLSLIEAPVPQIGPNDVLIRVKVMGICGTDIHIWDWDDWAASTVPVGLITGHEFAGEIVEIGSNVEGLKVGQRCTGEGHIVSNDSRQSRAGRFHLDPGTRGVGVNLQGSFAEYLCLPAFNVIPLPDEISDEIGAIMDPLGNAVHTALSFDMLGEDVLITGAGPIGIMAACIARFAGARHVVLTDINPDRLALAKTVAPDVRVVNVAKQSLSETADALGLTQGFDIGLEMSGSAQALNQMIEALDLGGRIALLGIPPNQAPVDLNKAVFKAITIKGIYGREMFETWYKMKAMLQQGLDVSKIITHRFAATDYREAFELMKSGKSGKILLHW